MYLFALVEEARDLVRPANCAVDDHVWVSYGGRACPFECPRDVPGNISQTAYRCTVCGEYDYGDVGGPGHADCVKYCNLGQ